MHPAGKKLRHAAPNNQNQGMAATMMSDTTQLKRKTREDTISFYSLKPQIIGRNKHSRSPMAKQYNQECYIWIGGESGNMVREAMNRIILAATITVIL